MNVELQRAPLVSALVDPVRVGDNWRPGVAQLIEAHERINRGLADRKDIHVLLDRYVAAYFPGQVVGYGDRHVIIHILRDRQMKRVWAYLDRILEDGPLVGPRIDIKRT